MAAPQYIATIFNTGTGNTTFQIPNTVQVGDLLVLIGGGNNDTGNGFASGLNLVYPGPYPFSVRQVKSSSGPVGLDLIIADRFVQSTAERLQIVGATVNFGQVHAHLIIIRGVVLGYNTNNFGQQGTSNAPSSPGYGAVLQLTAPVIDAWQMKNFQSVTGPAGVTTVQSNAINSTMATGVSFATTTFGPAHTCSIPASDLWISLGSAYTVPSLYDWNIDVVTFHDLTVGPAQTYQSSGTPFTWEFADSVSNFPIADLWDKLWNTIPTIPNVVYNASSSHYYFGTSADTTSGNIFAYHFMQSCFRPDTSAIPDNAVLLDARLEVRVFDVFTPGAPYQFDMEVRHYNDSSIQTGSPVSNPFDTSIEVRNNVSTKKWSDYPLLGTVPNWNSQTFGTILSIPVPVSTVSKIGRSGPYVFGSSKYANPVPPGDVGSFSVIQMYGSIDGSSTPPKLIVTYGT